MSLTLKQALALKNGTLLSFGNEYVYEVLGVEPRNKGRDVYIILERDDGLATFAIESHLSKVTILDKKEAIEKIVTPNITAQALEHMGGDTEVTNTPHARGKGKHK